MTSGVYKRTKQYCDSRRHHEVSAKTKKKISETLSGRKLTIQHREHMKIARRGKLRGPMSAEQKEKISFAKRGKTHSCSDMHKQRIREGAIRRVEKLTKQCGRAVSAWVGLYENVILDDQEMIDNCKIIRQFHVIGYVVDGYCKETNVVYEVDDVKHFNRDGTYTNKDIVRQKRIENFLQCVFVRIRIDKNGKRLGD